LKCHMEMEQDQDGAQAQERVVEGAAVVEWAADEVWAVEIVRALARVGFASAPIVGTELHTQRGHPAIE